MSCLCENAEIGGPQERQPAQVLTIALSQGMTVKQRMKVTSLQVLKVSINVVACELEPILSGHDASLHSARMRTSISEIPCGRY